MKDIYSRRAAELILAKRGTERLIGTRRMGVSHLTSSPIGSQYAWDGRQPE